MFTERRYLKRTDNSIFVIDYRDDVQNMRKVTEFWWEHAARAAQRGLYLVGIANLNKNGDSVD